MYPKIFQCDNGREFKGEVNKMLEKQEVKILRVTMKYKHTHRGFCQSSEQNPCREIIQGAGCTRVK